MDLQDLHELGKDEKEQLIFLGVDLDSSNSFEPVKEFKNSSAYSLDCWILEEEETVGDNILQRIGPVELESGLDAVENTTPTFVYGGRSEGMFLDEVASVVDVGPDYLTSVSLNEEILQGHRIEKVSENELSDEYLERFPDGFFDYLPLFGRNHYEVTDYFEENHNYDPDLVISDQTEAHKVIYDLEENFEKGDYLNKAYGCERGFFI